MVLNIDPCESKIRIRELLKISFKVRLINIGIAFSLKKNIAINKKKNSQSSIRFQIDDLISEKSR